MDADPIATGSPDFVTEALNRLASKRRPTILYHYTSPAGLLGILAGKAIWATDILHLNDFRELVYTIDLAKLVVAEDPRRAGAHGHLRYVFEECDNVLTLFPRFRVYVCSFSEDGDLLSQWRAYCPPEGGFAVGIDSATLEEATDALLLPCNYDVKEQKRIIREGLDLLLTSYPNLLEPNDDLYTYKRIGAAFFQYILTCASSFKDPSFHEEKEWRLVLTSSRPRPSTLSFRVGRGGIVPYVELSLHSSPDARFQELIVGPNRHADLAVKAVRLMLNAQQASTAADRVRASRVPYRAW